VQVIRIRVCEKLGDHEDLKWLNKQTAAIAIPLAALAKVTAVLLCEEAGYIRLILRNVVYQLDLSKHCNWFMPLWNGPLCIMLPIIIFIRRLKRGRLARLPGITF